MSTVRSLPYWVTSSEPEVNLPVLVSPLSTEVVWLMVDLCAIQFIPGNLQLPFLTSPTTFHGLKPVGLVLFFPSLDLFS